MVLFILLGGYPPFYDESEPALFAQIRKGSFSFDDPVWDTISDRYLPGLVQLRWILLATPVSLPWRTTAPSLDRFGLKEYCRAAMHPPADLGQPVLGCVTHALASDRVSWYIWGTGCTLARLMIAPGCPAAVLGHVQAAQAGLCVLCAAPRT